VKAVQDEASPTPLPGKPPIAKTLLLGESQNLLRAYFQSLLQKLLHYRGIQKNSILGLKDICLIWW
jgi:hypothetical protein